MPSKDDEWIVLRRYDDGMAAQIALDFLRDHDVPVGLRGNSGATSVLNRFDTVLDVRLIVRKGDLAHAQEALRALESPPASSRIGEEHLEEEARSSGHPYRAIRAPVEEKMPRYRRAAFALALLVPIGSGHFYARESHAGLTYLVGILGCAALAAASWQTWPIAASGLLVLLDAATSPAAVVRHNAGAPCSPTAQIGRGLLALTVALTASFVLVR